MFRALISRPSSKDAFTLLELLVVIGIISVLLVAIVPAVNSLSKSSGRKAAVSNLLNALEKARSQAIKDGRSTYVAFAAQPTDGSTGITDKPTLDRYFYHSYAIFEDDPTDSTKPKVQVTPWRFFPTGISLRTEISFSKGGSTTNASWTSADFAFTPVGTATQKFPYMQFDSTGALSAPATLAIGPIRFRLFEGYVSGTAEHPTTQANKDEVITINTVTGRGEYNL
jgi:prepilin-type N-terminal cleavage/methylation domain-containing protein